MKNKNLLIIAIVLLILTSTVYAASIDSEIEDQLEENNMVSVIVMLKNKEVKSDKLEYKQAGIKKQQNLVLSKLEIKNENKHEVEEETNESFDIEIKHEFSSINGFSGYITKQGLEKLVHDENVESIRISGVKYISLDLSIPLINATETWGLIYNNTNITGKGETVCILDTGVDYTHTNLGGCLGDGCKVVAGYDFVNSDSNPMDDNGHGTHVAGIVASNHSTYKGVAPDAKIVAIKVCNSGGNCSDTNINAGIDWCTTNSAKYNISVITISLGDCSNHSTYCNDDNSAPFIDAAVEQGIVVTIAAGNGPSGSCSGITNTNGPSSPACVENAIAVGAVSDVDAINYQRGALFELLTPGTDICSTMYPGDSGITCGDGTFISKGGTSMATPHVAGSVTLLQQFNKLQNRTNLTPQEVKDVLNSTGKIIDDSGGSGYSFSRIDIYSAIISLDSVAPTVDLISPSNNSFISNTSITFNYSTSENGKCSLYLNTSGTLEINTTNNSIISGSNNFAILLSDSTSWLWNIECNDSANNSANSTNSFIITIDATNPQINFSNSTPENSTTQSQAYIQIYVNYTETNFQNITWNINGTTYTNTTQVYEYNETGLSDGNYTYNVTVCDRAGNCNTTETRLIILDLLAPQFNPPLSNQIIEYNTPFTYDINTTDSVDNFTVSDTTNFSINSSGYLTNNTLLTIGVYNLNITVNDTLGNENSGIINITVQDTTYPIFNPIPSNQEINYNQAFIYDINATDLLLANYSVNNTNFAIDPSNGTITNNTLLSVGTHHLQIRVNDTSGNTNSTAISIVVKLNKTQEIIANTLTNVSLDEADTNLTLYLNQSFNTTIIVKKETPTASGTTSSKTSVKGINISLDDNTNSSLEWAIIKLFYNDSEITGLEESSLILYFYNETLRDWIAQSTTVNTDSNFASANVTHFSLYGLFGSAPAGSDPPSGGGGGGGSSTTSITNIELTTTATSYTGLKRNDKLSFVSKSGGHILTIKKIDNTVVEFILQSNPITFNLNIGEEKTLDLGSDEKLSIRLDGINSKKADISLNNVIKKKPLTIINTQKEETKTTSEETTAEEKTIEKTIEIKEKRTLKEIFIGSIIIFVILSIGIAFIVFLNKEEGSDHALKHIGKKIKKGHSEEKIKKSLKNKGWDEKEIDDMIKHIKR
jgi:hypothetical protein